MKFITKRRFQTLVTNDKYWQHRWKYIDVAISILKTKKFNSVLELGPYKAPIVSTSDVMDFKSHIDVIKFLWDARNTPWPIKDKTYDMFIALQVWEHLYTSATDLSIGYQEQAFSEVMRISKSALLSFPYKWKHGKANHRGIDKQKISQWTLNIPPLEIIPVGNKLVYYFEF